MYLQKEISKKSFHNTEGDIKISRNYSCLDMADSTVEQQGASTGVPGEAGGPARAVGAEAGQLGGRAVLAVQQHHRVVRQF